MQGSKPQWMFWAGLSLAVGMAANVQAAGVVTKLEASATNVTLENGKAVVKFTVIGTAEDGDNCGLWVEYGDGTNPDTRVVNKQEGLFPRTFEHEFTKPGGFSVKAKGQRVKTSLGCVGEATSFVTVNAPAAAAKSAAAKTGAAGKAAPPAPTCPDGWQLVANSHNPKTGEFSCSAKPPASKLECGQGLAYYEKEIGRAHV